MMWERIVRPIVLNDSNHENEYILTAASQWPCAQLHVNAKGCVNARTPDCHAIATDIYVLSGLGHSVHACRLPLRAWGKS